LHDARVGTPGQFVHQRVGTGILPDQGRTDRVAGVPVPQYGRLPLVGDAECGDLVRRDAGLGNRRGRDLLEVAPDLRRVVFHPAWLGEQLLMLALGYRDQTAVMVEQNATCRGGALVNSHHEALGHPPASSREWNAWRSPA